MTQEDKQILFQDLCARLPYRVLCYYETSDTFERMFGKLTFNALKSFVTNKPLISEENQYRVYDYCVKSIKPYLRSLSSMTEEEDKEYAEVIVKSQDCSLENSESATTMANDWLLSKHFDVRGLISKGLAIEVTKENNPYEN